MKLPTFDPQAAIRSGNQPPPWYHFGAVQALAGEPADQNGKEGSTESTTSADVYLYNTIGGWFGLTAQDFVKDVSSLDVDQIVLHLNTPGGDVMEGVTIANVLRSHRAKVVVRVDGLAASAGSVIAMAGDEIVMGIASEMMLHDVWGIAIGNVAEMEAYIRQLESASNSIAAAYAAKAGGTAADWRDVMRKESWYTAQEAVDAGLTDRVAAADEKATAQGEQVTPGGSGSFWDMWDTLRSPERFDLSAFTYAGRAHAPAPTRPASAGGSNPREGNAAMADTQFSEDQLKELRTTLGLDDKADADAIHAALTDRLSSTDDEGDEGDEGTGQAAAPATTLPEGTVAIDSTQLAALQAAARRGDEARRQQEQESRESMVNAAVADGRIPPARREHWLDMLAKDPGSADVLAKMAPGLIPVDGPKGYAADGPDGNDSLYDSVFGKDA